MRAKELVAIAFQGVATESNWFRDWPEVTSSPVTIERIDVSESCVATQ
jgi:hypothetical protein